jgi:alkaline phosphatase
MILLKKLNECIKPKPYQEKINYQIMKTNISRLSIFLITIIFATACAQLSRKDSSNPDNNSAPTNPKNIILMIGDGMGTSQVYATLTAKHGKLEMARCRHIGFVKTDAADDYITDSAAGATAFATGSKTNNGVIAMDPYGDTLNTILEYAEYSGLGTGLVATSKITHATPAGFIAHNESRDNYEEIAEDFLLTDVDVILGGGLNNFNHRNDGQDLLDKLRLKNYQLVFDTAEMSGIDQGKIFGLLWEDHPPKWTEGRDNFLEKASLKAIELLLAHEKGFFLLVEGSQIDWGGHDNDSEYLVSESVDFDNVVGKVLDFAEENGETLVIITADHETGGYSINGGDIASGEVVGAFTTDEHSSTMVPLFAFGPGAENFTGIIDNTEIYYKMMNLLSLKEDLGKELEPETN